jgi:uncharacterized protein (DUF302 family)
MYTYQHHIMATRMKQFISIILMMVFHQLTYATNTNEEDLYFKKMIYGDFSEIVSQVKAELQKQGFSVITEIDMDKKLNEKLNTHVKPYKILGACNPGYAYNTLQIDDNIGVFLPCKVIVKQLDQEKVEVVSINPSMMMRMLNNDALTKVAEEVSKKLKTVIDNL